MVGEVPHRTDEKLEIGAHAEIHGANSPISVRGRQLLHVIRVRYLQAYVLEVEFNDGVVKQVDLSRELYGEVFEPLKDLELFKRVTMNNETNTIEWPNGADVAPEYLYEIGEQIKQVA